ncbi:MAG: YegS/Rv2252/BmrU family lipid kinase [Chloroflexi bacterium]|nr:YegS/Rv2252/BmrU family lipid kinase [Chloroflexota bacterium]
MSTLVVVNPNASAGRAAKLWRSFEPAMAAAFPGMQVAVTQSERDLPDVLGGAIDRGVERVIAVGGDGTNYAMVNALVHLHDQNPNRSMPVYGTFPIGTGCDFATARGIPKGSSETVAWLAAAKPAPVDIGVVQFTHKDGATGRRCYLNIASGGASGDVSRRVNTALVKRPWTYLAATLASVLSYRPSFVDVKLDGQEFFRGEAILVTCANSTTFGHGMIAAPNAKIDDGLLDVVILRDAGRISTLKALKQVYTGAHLSHPAVMSSRAREVRIETGGQVIDGDLDGEHFQGSDWLFTLRPGLLPILMH